MKSPILRRFKELVEKTYGTTDDPRGAYLNGAWLSIENVMALAEQAEEEDSSTAADHFKELIEKKYGTTDDPRGAYLNGVWLSVENIMQLVERACT